MSNCHNTEWVGDRAVIRYNSWIIGMIEPDPSIHTIWWHVVPAHKPAGEPQASFTPMVMDDFGSLVPCLGLFERWLS